MVKALASGKLLVGLEVNSTKAVGHTTLNEITNFGMRSPLLLATTARRSLSHEDLDIKNLREISQRSWNKSRKTRAKDYKSYIGGLMDGSIQMGDTPPIDIYVSEQGVADDEGGFVTFPFTSKVICIDGETQMEARYQLLDERPETGDTRFAITIHHGISSDAAAQILHDFNAYGVRIPETQIGYRNNTGAVSAAIEDARAAAGIDDDDFNQKGKTGTKKTVAGFAQSSAFVVGYVSGQPSLAASWSTRFGGLNRPESNGHINGACGSGLVEVYNLAKADKNIGMASPNVWHAAGVLLKEGRAPSTLNWDAGFLAQVTFAGKGKGNSGPISERLKAIYEALK